MDGRQCWQVGKLECVKDKLVEICLKNVISNLYSCELREVRELVFQACHSDLEPARDIGSSVRLVRLCIFNETGGIGKEGGSVDLLSRNIPSTEGYVLTDADIEDFWFLCQVMDLTSESCRTVVDQLGAIDRNVARGWLVEAAKDMSD